MVTLININPGGQSQTAMAKSRSGGVTHKTDTQEKPAGPVILLPSIN